MEHRARSVGRVRLLVADGADGTGLELGLSVTVELGLRVASFVFHCLAKILLSKLKINYVPKGKILV